MWRAADGRKAIPESWRNELEKDERTDPFILVHEGRFRLSDMSGKETKHPHRGFDNLWYVLQGSASTGHTTGPGGSVERARLSEG
jgi:redox-sensitive bicupin YhaK (pirin superfamily)